MKSEDKLKKINEILSCSESDPSILDEMVRQIAEICAS